MPGTLPFCLIAVALAAGAPNSGTDLEPTQDDRIVVTASKSVREVDTTPATIAVIDGESIDGGMALLGAQDLAELIPGGPTPGEGMESEMAPESMPEIVSADEAIHTAAIPAIDPQTMQTAEIDKVLPPGARCGCAYTASSRPVLSGSNGAGVAKIHGRLVELRSDATTAEALAGTTTFQTEGMRLTVRPFEEKPRVQDGENRQKAEMHFEIEDGPTVGYRCSSRGI